MKAGWKSRVILVSVLTLAANLSLAQGPNQRGEQLYGEARAAEEQGRIEAAIHNYEDIIKLNPRNPAAYNDLGNLYYRHGRLEKAIPALKRACQLDPRLEPPHALLGFSFYEIGAFKDADREFSKAVQLNPHDANAKLFLARSLIELDQPEAALRLLEELHQEAPKNAEVLYSLGTLYANLAASTLGQIKRVAPDSYLIPLLLGQYAESKGDDAQAADEYRIAITKAPEIIDLHYRYAHALWASGHFSDALTEYRHVLRLNPLDYRANWEAARCVLPTDPKEAFRLANRALKMKPDVAEALTIRGRSLLALRRPAQAIEDLNKAATLDPQDATNHFLLARAYRQLGQEEAAQKEIGVYQRMQYKANTPSRENNHM